MEIVTKQQKIDVLEGIFGESTLANSGKNVSVICPACKSDSKSSSRKKKLSICLNKGIYHCWVCEAKGHNIAKFAIRNTFVNKSDVATLNDLFSFDENKEEKETEYLLRLPEDFSLLCHDNTRQAKIAKRYLHKRGCTPDDLIKYKIGISNKIDYVNRIIIPSFSKDMKLNFFLSRSYDEKTIRKYKNCDAQKTKIIFNEYLIDWTQPLTIVEGVFDAIKAGENAVPILGSWIDKKHYVFQKIVQNKTPTVLGLDPDAIEKTMKIAKSLTSFGIDVKICNHTSSDFGEMTKKEVKYYIENAKKYEISDRITYLIKNISSGSIF
jgi:hypothetical protein